MKQIITEYGAVLPSGYGDHLEALVTTMIVLYAMHYDSELLRRLPFLSHGAERGFVQLAALRAPDARVVIITPNPIEDDVVQYYLRDLAGFRDEELPAILDRLTLVQPLPRNDAALDLLVLQDTALLAQLRDLAQRGGPALLVNFCASPEADAIGAALGIPVEQSPHDRTRQWGGKHGGKQVLRLGNVPTPAGPATRLHTSADVLSACRRFGSGTEFVAVKLDDQKWGNAVGILVLDRSAVVAAMDVSSGIVKSEQPWLEFLAELEQGGAIVEEYLPNVVASPSGQAFIDQHGNVHVVSTHDQLLDGDRYIGCVGPLTRFGAEIGTHLRAVGEVLAGYGVRGCFGVDFIVLPDGSVLATEINLRKVGTSHVVAHVAHLTGALSKWPAAFVHRRTLAPEVLGRLTPRVVIDTLRGAGLLFDHDTGTGALLHTLGAVAKGGYLETTCVESSRAAAFELDRDVHDVLGLELSDRIRFATVG